MNLRHLTDANLLIATENEARLERETTTRLLWHLREVDRRKVYAQVGTNSLFDYCVRVLKMSEPQAARRVNAARALAEIPELEAKISSGALSLTAVSQAQSFFRREGKSKRPVGLEKKKEILSQLENISTREAERVLLSHSAEPKCHRPEKRREVSPELTEVRLTLDAETIANLDRLKEIWSHEMPHATYADVIKKMSVLARTQADPDKKAERARQRLEKKSASQIAPTLAPEWEAAVASRRVVTDGKMTHMHTLVPPSPELKQSGQDSRVKLTRRHSPLRAHIPSTVRHHVWMRDGGRCTFVDRMSGRICGSRHQVQHDHVQPVALGGDNSAENLRLRCSLHNQWQAMQSFGREVIARRR